MTVRTRFAPSPTGNLHVGSVRTALFAWLYAKQHQGQFILRIEDTDEERSTQASTDIILESMKWLGMNPDEGPFYQHDRLARYTSRVNQLLEEGKAYRCYCSKERLSTLREEQMKNKQKPKYDGCCRDKQLPHRESAYVIRFNNPLDGEVSFTDEVYGHISVLNSELDDLIIQRSDGLPTYNFAVVVDDWEMGITHVIRGDDHLSNTPRQINLYKAFDVPLPHFIHLPMILGNDGKRLSKRHGAVSVLQFKEQGYLPHALLNYLVRLGWSRGDQEIFSMAEMIEFFDVKSVSKGTSSFSYEKLLWLNQHYLKTAPIKDIAEILRPMYKKSGINIDNGPALEVVVPLLTQRSNTLNEIVEKSLYFYVDDVSYDEKAVNKHLKESILAPFSALYERYLLLEAWEEEDLHAVITDIAEQFDLKMGKIAQPIRVAVTGSTMSPSIDITLKLLGKEKSLKRIKAMIEHVQGLNG